MWEGGVYIYDTPGVSNNFPKKERGSSIIRIYYWTELDLIYLGRALQQELLLLLFNLN